tara:strand:- start:177 stop:596 length:420 start_codon:yes stop_codon:yes gene_type:complete
VFKLDVSDGCKEHYNDYLGVLNVLGSLKHPSTVINDDSFEWLEKKILKLVTKPKEVDRVKKDVKVAWEEWKREGGRSFSRHFTGFDTDALVAMVEKTVECECKVRSKRKPGENKMDDIEIMLQSNDYSKSDILNIIKQM